MISCDFAPNEQWDDAWLSIKLIFQPWRWKRGREIEEAKQKLLQRFHVSNPNVQTFLFFSGRSALFFLLHALRLPKNAEVIVQGFTCEAVILPILANNLKPVYADIESSTFSIDPIDLERKINGNTKVIILQHTYGITPIHREKIRSVSRRKGIVLIEDIAHGAEMDRLETKTQGSIFLLSFGRSKAFSSVFGGAIVTGNRAIARYLKEKEQNLKTPTSIDIFRLLLYKPLSMLIKSTYDIGPGKILHEIVRSLRLLPPELSPQEKRGHYNHYLDRAYPSALATLLIHQLNKSEATQAMRKQAVELYHRKVRDFDSQVSNGALIRYPLIIKHRDTLKNVARKENVFLGLWYNQAIGDCPVAESICKNIINLPTTIQPEEIERVITIVNRLNDVNYEC